MLYIIPEELCKFTTMSMPLVVDRYKGDTAAFQKCKGDIADFQKCALVKHRHFRTISYDLIAYTGKKINRLEIKG